MVHGLNALHTLQLKNGNHILEYSNIYEYFHVKTTKATLQEQPNKHSKPYVTHLRAMERKMLWLTQTTLTPDIRRLSAKLVPTFADRGC
jgi:hypothetical protein